MSDTGTGSARFTEDIIVPKVTAKAAAAKKAAAKKPAEKKKPAKKNVPAQQLPPAELPTEETAQEYIDFAKQWSNETGVAGQVRPLTPEQIKAEKTKEEVRQEKIAVRNWEEIFVSQYPQYGWMLTDLDRTKYKDVFSLFEKAVDPESGYTEERFKNELYNTTWFSEIRLSNKAADIKTLVGSLTWDAGSYSRFLSKAVNYGWKDEQLSQEAYKELFSKKDDGSYTNSTAVGEIKNGPKYLSYAKTAKSFFTTMSDSNLEKVLTGQVTDADIITGFRETAKLKYRHLAPALDAGQTLEDLTADYKSWAAKLLEKPETDIDMSNPDFESALTYNDGKETRMMTTGEWRRKIKTEPKYGWDKTQQALDTGRNIALNIVKNFQGAF